jgi:hypothetical protein
MLAETRLYVGKVPREAETKVKSKVKNSRIPNGFCCLWPLTMTRQGVRHSLS